MTITDEQFREEHKPLRIPSRYDTADTKENKILFALAELGEGTAVDVIGELEKLEPGLLNAQFIALIKDVLARHYKNGLLKGIEKKGQMHYNLSKETYAHDGNVDPRLLAPGLD